MSTRITNVAFTVALITAAVGSANPARAGVVGYYNTFAGVESNNGVPRDLRVGHTQDDTRARAYQEGALVTLPVNTMYHATSFSGNIHYNSNAQLTQLPIPGGGSTIVNSYIVHYDPTSIFTRTTTGYIDFDNPVYVITKPNSDLDATDHTLGIASWQYPAGLSDRGFDMAQANDTFSLYSPAPGVWRVEWELESGVGVDQMRIVEITPTPATLGLLSAGGLLMARRRRS